MKILFFLFVLLVTLFGQNNSSPSMKELQQMVESMQKAYGIITQENSEYNPEKKYTDKEIQEQVDKINSMLKENNKLQYTHPK